MKTYVFDASALFIFLQRKAAAVKVGQLLKDALSGRAEIIMSAVNYGEVYGVILREYGMERASITVSALHPLPIQLIDATPECARRAAEVKLRHKLHYIDSFAASLVIDLKATLVTSDADFRAMKSVLSILWLKN